jgi:hypothetical protein
MGKIKAGFYDLSRSEGLAHIENYYRSGLRPFEYCKQQGITECQFYGWRKRYLNLHPDAAHCAGVGKKFHPVKIESSGAVCISGIEIHYPHGVRLILSNDHPVAIETLTALIKLHVSCFP